MTPAAAPVPFDPHARLAAFLRDAANAIALSESDSSLCGRQFHLNIARGCIAGAEDCAAAIATQSKTRREATAEFLRETAA